LSGADRHHRYPFVHTTHWYRKKKKETITHHRIESNRPRSSHPIDCDQRFEETKKKKKKKKKIAIESDQDSHLKTIATVDSIRGNIRLPTCKGPWNRSSHHSFELFSSSFRGDLHTSTYIHIYIFTRGSCVGDY